jgi:curved DNA-binding protein CbpA
MHPDKGGDQEEFKKLQLAYDTLFDKDKREVYDKYGAEGI